jgi:hypothetical protein
MLFLKCFKYCGCGSNGICINCNNNFIGHDPLLDGSYNISVSGPATNTDGKICYNPQVDVSLYFRYALKLKLKTVKS